MDERQFSGVMFSGSPTTDSSPSSQVVRLRGTEIRFHPVWSGIEWVVCPCGLTIIVSDPDPLVYPVFDVVAEIKHIVGDVTVGA